MQGGSSVKKQKGKVVTGLREYKVHVYVSTSKSGKRGAIEP